MHQFKQKNQRTFSFIAEYDENQIETNQLKIRNVKA